MTANLQNYAFQLKYVLYSALINVNMFAGHRYGYNGNPPTEIKA
jgi:hypothetical protein